MKFMNNSLNVIESRFKKAQSIEGWMDDCDLAWIADQANKSALALEIGCWKGKTTQVMSLAQQLIVCDPFIGSPDDPSCGPDKIKGVYEEFLINTKEYSNINLYLMKSCFLSLKKQSFDFIFIDGDHKFEAVKHDIKLALDLIKPKGIIAGHDINLKSVIKALEPYSWIRPKINGNCWAIY